MPTKFIGKLFSLLFAVLVLAALSTGCFAWLYIGRTKDPTPVDISLQDKTRIIHFRIPKVYMTLSDNWEGGLQSVISLEVIYPSMAPVSATRNSGDGLDVAIISITSHESGGDYNVPRMLQEYYISKKWKLTERIPGYDVYIEKEPLEIIPKSLLEEYFVPTDGNGEIYLTCRRHAPRCSGNINFGENLSVRFTFERKLFLEKWKEIRQATLDLLNSFRVDQR